LLTEEGKRILQRGKENKIPKQVEGITIGRREMAYNWGGGGQKICRPPLGERKDLLRGTYAAWAEKAKGRPTNATRFPEPKERVFGKVWMTYLSDMTKNQGNMKSDGRTRDHPPRERGKGRAWPSKLI